MLPHRRAGLRRAPRIRPNRVIDVETAAALLAKPGDAALGLIGALAASDTIRGSPRRVPPYTKPHPGWPAAPLRIDASPPGMQMGAGDLEWLAAGQACNDRVQQSLLHRPGHLRVCEDVRSSLGEMACRFMQVPQPQQDGRRRSDAMREGRWGQFTTDKGVSGGHSTPLTGRGGSMLTRHAAQVPGDDLAKLSKSA